MHLALQLERGLLQQGTIVAGQGDRHSAAAEVAGVEGHLGVRHRRQIGSQQVLDLGHRRPLVSVLQHHGHGALIEARGAAAEEAARSGRANRGEDVPGFRTVRDERRHIGDDPIHIRRRGARRPLDVDVVVVRVVRRLDALGQNDHQPG